MSAVVDASGSFADTLRRAVEGRGLGLERIREHLEQRGVSVSVATLSYWQSGRSTPGRKSSIAALPQLEDVLGLEPGALRLTLPQHRDRGRRCRPLDLGVVWPEPPQARVLRRLDTSRDLELDRVSLHDVLVVDADRRLASMTVRQTLRACTDGPDRRVVLHCHDDADAALPEIRAVQGCRLGRVEHDPSGVLGAELLFLEPLRRGQTVVLEHQLVARAAGPREREYTRRLRVPMRQYLLEVAFSAAAAPASCWAVVGEEERPLDLDPDHRVHLVDTDGTAGRTGIRWSWPDDPPPAAPHGRPPPRVNC